jgi:PAS domain S-box-containing protein
MNEAINILCLEDSEKDAEIIRELVIDAGYELTMDCTKVEKEFVSFLRSNEYNIILADFRLPGFDGFAALKWSVEICPNVPFICISGTIGEEIAVELLKKGATDYIMKDKLIRLPSAMHRALMDAKEKEARQRAEKALTDSELRYRRLFEAARDGILILDAETGMVVDVNPFLIEMLGFSREQFLYKRIWEQVFCKYIFPDQASFEELREKKYIRYDDKPMETIDRRRIEVEFVGNVYEVDSHKVMQCNICDISQRKLAEKELFSLNAQLELRVLERTSSLELANKELESFSYSVSHDLRAPLRAINGYAKILQEDTVGKLDEDGMHSLNAIMNNSKKMGALIEDLLAFSRLGRNEIKTSEINMTVLVKSVREEEIHRNTKEVAFKIFELLPAKGQQELIKQVWVNLISNAIKFSKYKPKPNIEIGSYLKGNLVVYYIKDNGAGFDMQYYNKLFGVFQRLHTQGEFEGTGIGLAIVQKIIVRNNGTVWAESKLNEGACFYFSLPAISS